jgi:hypothetical protein
MVKTNAAKDDSAAKKNKAAVEQDDAALQSQSGFQKLFVKEFVAHLPNRSSASGVGDAVSEVDPNDSVSAVGAKRKRIGKITFCHGCDEPVASCKWPECTKRGQGWVMTDLCCLDCKETYEMGSFSTLDPGASSFESFTKVIKANPIIKNTLKVANNTRKSALAGIRKTFAPRQVSSGCQIRLKIKNNVVGLKPGEFKNKYNYLPQDVGIKLKDLLGCDGKKYKGVTEVDEANPGVRYTVSREFVLSQEEFLMPKEHHIFQEQGDAVLNEAESDSWKKGTLQNYKNPLTSDGIKQKIDAHLEKVASQSVVPPTAEHEDAQSESVSEDDGFAEDDDAHAKSGVGTPSQVLGGSAGSGLALTADNLTAFNHSQASSPPEGAAKGEPTPKKLSKSVTMVSSPSVVPAGSALDQADASKKPYWAKKEADQYMEELSFEKALTKQMTGVQEIRAGQLFFMFSPCTILNGLW